MFQRILRGLVDVLAPPCCAACSLSLAQHESGFCPGCEILIDEAAHDPQTSDYAACVYGGPVADAITRLKYDGRSDLAPALSRLLLARLSGLSGLADLVCCVPLHPQRLRERGYNQSALLAGPVARSLGVGFRPGLIVRTRATPAQAGLNRSARQQNLLGAFRVRGDVRGQRVLVVDDVATTYATLAELRRVLEAAGASAVCTLALARTQRDDAQSC